MPNCTYDNDMKSCFLLVAKRVQFADWKAKIIPIVLCSHRVFDYKPLSGENHSPLPSRPIPPPSSAAWRAKPGAQARRATAATTATWQLATRLGARAGSRSGRASTCELTYFWPAQAGDGWGATQPAGEREGRGEAASQLNFPCCLAWATCGVTPSA